MAYEPKRLNRIGTFGVYELRLGEEDKHRLSEDFLRELLAKEGAPDPNEIIIHQPAGDSTDSKTIGDIFKTILGPDPGGGGHPPPVVILFHQESEPHISRYITQILEPV